MTAKKMYFHDHPLSYKKVESYPCGICEEKGGLFIYCNKCQFWRHEKCWKESALFESGQRPHRHDHPLSLEEFKPYICCFCNENVGYGYDCDDCSFFVHEKCINSLNLDLSLCKHSLKICVRGSLKYPHGQCHFCKEDILGAFFFHCSVCNISVDQKCMVSPQRPLTLHNPKNHEHSLTLLQRLVTFTCNGCGLQGDRNPYICLECDFMMHKDCVDLPRVISINRHDHRISRTSHLGYRDGDWECGVCRQKIDWVYGAFECKRCPGYAVHSKCATRKDVWDGKELEDEPEEEEVEDPFEVISETEIIHFSHKEHHLRLSEDYVTDHDNIRCVSCVIPINDSPFYKCVECDFYLHKACASFPLRKAHFLHNHKLALHTAFSSEDGFKCSACDQHSNGFRYKCREPNQQQAGCNTKVLDVRCVSLSEPFHHELHIHPLYHISTKDAICQGCGANSSYVLSCTKCEWYNLCMKCATLPRRIKNRCDDSFLSLCHGAENASGDLWCDICEAKTDPKVWYYTCDQGRLSLHVNCVLGDLFYIKPGKLGNQHHTLSNNGVTRPVCSICKDHCRFPSLIMAEKGGDRLYMCSFGCGKN